MSQETNALDLYARIEDLLGVKEAAPDLYAHYLLMLRNLPFDSLLDVGCGKGDFIASIQKVFPEAVFRGIDLSPQMILSARRKGIDAEAIDLCEDRGKYGVVTAVFDVLNYLTKPELERFGKCVKNRLVEGGYFLCDVNTLYGFEEVAVGLFFAEDDRRYVAVEGEFDGNKYDSDFTLFEQRDNGCWQRSQSHIRQYFHDDLFLDRALDLERVFEEPIRLFGEGIDKKFIVYNKSKQ